MPKDNVTAAKQGETIALTFGPYGKPTTHEVLAPCDEKNNGHWYCVTHKQHFPNQLQKDGHIHVGKHKLVWVCHRHGPEQP
jgi:hypothetical protein